MDSPDLCKDCWDSLILTTAEKCHPQLNLVMTAPEIQSFAVKGSSPPPCRCLTYVQFFARFLGGFFFFSNFFVTTFALLSHDSAFL